MPKSPNSISPEPKTSALFRTLANLELCLAEKGVSGKDMDMAMFLADRECFLKNNDTLTGDWPSLHPDLRYVATPRGPRLLFMGFPWKPMLDLFFAVSGEEKPEKFSDGNLTQRSLDVLHALSIWETAHGVKDPLDWNGKVLQVAGAGAEISLERFENAVFPWRVVRDRRDHRESTKNAAQLMRHLEDHLGEKKEKPDFSETYRIIDLRDPDAAMFLREIFRNCQFDFYGYPEAADDSLPIFSYAARPHRECCRKIDLEHAPDNCENPWCVVKIEDGYPHILPFDSCFAGFKSIREATLAIRNDMKDATPWLVTLHHQTWQPEFYSFTAIPKTFGNPAEASRWLCEKCGFSESFRGVEIFIDGINTAYFEDLPGKEGYRIMRGDTLK